MVVQIAGLDKLDIRMRRRNLVGKAVDAVDQDAAEQEIGENDDALEPRRVTCSRHGWTSGKVTPEYPTSAQPKPMPSHSMREIFEMLELASGSEAPRPITTRQVSARSTGPCSLSAASMAAAILSPAACSI